LCEKTDKIHHIPEVLYHWRKLKGSTAMSFDYKDYAQVAGRKAILTHLERSGIRAEVVNGKWPGSYRVKYEIDEAELISIIIPFKDNVQVLKDCIKSIQKKTTYKNFEILLVSNNSSDPKTFAYLKEITAKSDNIRYVEYNVPFNYSQINNWAVKQVKGKHLLFLNDDITAINKGWLTAMAEHIQRPEVGAVGAKLLYPDGSIQHAGVILGLGGVAGHAFNGMPGHKANYNMDEIVRGISACTAACLLVKREAFEKIQGFDEENLKIAFNDVDLCMKITDAEYKIIYTPFAELYHYESKSRGYENTPEKVARFNSEVAYMINKWKEKLTDDPYYSPKLSLKHQQYQLNLQPQIDELLKTE